MLLKSSFNMTTHDHTRLKIQEAITKLGWIVLPYPPYNPALAASDFHLFAALKNDIAGNRFGSHYEVTEEVAASAGFRLL
jgi:hypothetical protein